MCLVAIHKLSPQSFSRRIPLSPVVNRIKSGLLSLSAVLGYVASQRVKAE